ncbi:enoyl-CoA hydratase/isomerase family protein [Flavobacterium crassostreae]|uniref:Enoyl-CoA hydratase n=1 Tax=Flavobacterium crassostreae TaxID=1763534 RepID=A0A1B9E0F1_9FLAO|nr:enoyl-CoA hydratase-related protein [Flavobacterium crassostreae]OCB75433.1 enoyl-CoA hydratase [Flavobacterium crassostreae]
MTYKNILITTDNKVTTITIHRPSKLNALNMATIEELHQAFAQVSQDKQTQVIVLTGSGDKAFVAGADIAEFAGFSVQEGIQLAAHGQESLFNFIENLNLPVIAAINGFALGGGLELAMACHIRVASENAKMGLPEVSLGVIPGYGGTQRLPQLIGKGRALEMIMTASMVSAKEAHRTGLVNHVVAPTELLAFCNGMAQKIVPNSPVAIGMAIDAVNANFKEGENGFETEIKAFGKCFGTDDFKEGTTAFLEKRKAVFSGK